jgi:SAM-dependent methyltransferase
MSELPFPPDQIVLTSVGKLDKKMYLAGGVADKDSITRLLGRAGLDPTSRKMRILDWGSGSGRVARHWESLQDNISLYGCDVLAEPVEWCRQNLSFGQFSVSQHFPPLDYPDNHFDAVYAISVLTHMSLDAHYLWMKEIWRILKTNGIAIFTVQGPSLLPTLLTSIARKPAERIDVDLLDEHAFIYVYRGLGLNATGNIVPPGAFARIFEPFDVLEYRPRHGLMGIHDSYVIRKKDGDHINLREDLLQAKMRGSKFQAEIEVQLNRERTFSVLAGARDLVRSATIQLSLRHAVTNATITASRAVDLPLRGHWAQLPEAMRVHNAFSTVKIEKIPQLEGPVKLLVDVTTSDTLNGAQLLLRQAMFY